LSACDPIALGLAIAELCRKPGHRLTCDDIADFCGCSGAYIRQIEKRALRKLKVALKRQSGITDLSALEPVGVHTGEFNENKSPGIV
jgi:hypothetical protein